jgi:hypothetical protein
MAGARDRASEWLVERVAQHRLSRATGRQGGAPPSTIGILIVALVVLVLANLGLTLLGNGQTTASTTETSAAPLPSTTATPTTAPTLTLASPTAPVIVLPTASLAVVTPSPTPELTLAPTPAPTPTPALATIEVRIPDRLFLGDYWGTGSGTYHGRTATWIYGQGTPYSAMTAQFELEQTRAAIGQASLMIVGLEGSEPTKQSISIVLNGETIYEGQDPLPNDFSAGPSGPGNWGSATFKFAADILKRNNELTITNLTNSDCTLCSDFVLIDYGLINYRVTV